MVDCRWIVASLAEGRILREPGWTVENFWNDTVEGELLCSCTSARMV